MKPLNIKSLNWQKSDGLIPAIIQHAITGQVLMLGYMNKAALAQTLKTKRVTFYSRAKESLWVKGETSGHFLNLINISKDCDNDTLLILAEPEGSTCHLDRTSCFEELLTAQAQLLFELESIISERDSNRPEKSYTATLLDGSINKIAQKVGEEGTEVVIAALNESDERLCEEVSDLCYHVLVLLRARQLSISDVMAVLSKRSEN